MKRPRFVISIALFALLGWIGCAPVDEPTTDSPGAQGEQIGKPKPIDVNVDLGMLKERVQAALNVVKDRDLLTTHAFWTVFHGILGNGLDAKIRNTFTKEEYSALDYIRKGGAIAGLEFIVHENIADGKDGIDVRIGPTFVGQGHPDQFVAEMAQLGLPLDTEFRINYRGELRKYTFADFIRYSKAKTEIGGDVELTWTMPAVAQYYGTQLSWTNASGKKIDFEDMVRHELNQPIDTAACGGTHRLFGLTWAYYIHRRANGKMTPVWEQVAAKLKKYRDIAEDSQNRVDGSFSTDYFKSKSQQGDMDRKIGTTGHIVEWLALYLPDDELRAEWMQLAVYRLSLMILDSRKELLDGGSVYHAAHGLHLYYYRVWNDEDTNPCAKVIPLPPPQD
jgi:hypothetical protein